MSANNGLTPYASPKGVLSLEACIDICNSNGTNNCVQVVWTTDVNHFCYLYSTEASCNVGTGAGNCYPNNIVMGQSGARLLTATAPKIIDYTSILQPGEAFNLGLCAGSSAPYRYDNTFVAVYSQANILRNGRTDIWLVTCGGNIYPPSFSTQIDTTQAIATVGYTSPANADDCARLCAYVEQYTDAHGTGTQPRCYTWLYATNGTCFLYSGRDGTSLDTPVQSAGIMAAGIYRGSTGNEFQPSAGYKRSLPDLPAAYRHHARDTMPDDHYQKADVILPWSSKKRNIAKNWQ